MKTSKITANTLYTGRPRRSALPRRRGRLARPVPLPLHAVPSWVVSGRRAGRAVALACPGAGRAVRGARHRRRARSHRPECHVQHRHLGRKHCGTNIDHRRDCRRCRGCSFFKG